MAKGKETEKGKGKSKQQNTSPKGKSEGKISRKGTQWKDQSFTRMGKARQGTTQERFHRCTSPKRATICAQRKAQVQRQTVIRAKPSFSKHQTSYTNSNGGMLGQNESDLVNFVSRNNRNIVSCRKLQDLEVQCIIKNCSQHLECVKVVGGARILCTKSLERPKHKNQPELVRQDFKQLNECNLTESHHQRERFWHSVDACLWRLCSS